MRIVIAEDAVLLRAGLVRLLTDAGHEIVAETDTAEGLVRAVEEHRPDFALVDVRLPPTFTDEGIRAAVLIRSSHPGVAVLVLSQYVEERYASELIASRREGLGYLLKDRVADVDQFLESVQTVGSGGTVLDPEVLTQILVRSRRREDMELLSPREREVLALMAQGLSNASIATNLYLTESAVEKHIGSIFAKLGVTSETGNRRVLAVLKYLGYSDHSL
ncbi:MULTISPECIES: response regulator transcription factor [Kocuria]|uniref:response regulator transcription factor n=1 Tax=Kocuria TaxID=57493 RepID=UPI000BF0C16E|nr:MULTISPECIES: response regulator transcription factor [Kocuria]MBN6812857.1 response regulator transcription factor [Kocuria indica]MBN6844507.1 response regulator transcription factor [Kocuria indica]MCT1722460.1 response regulator transcription factor [Kocuria marina]MCT1734822.1 response regulator transcription factor [Kocuria marina]MCT2020291.1 response regulator transcription factor [Kocuria marina]